MLAVQMRTVTDTRGNGADTLFVQSREMNSHIHTLLKIASQSKLQFYFFIFLEWTIRSVRFIQIKNML